MSSSVCLSKIQLSIFAQLQAKKKSEQKLKIISTRHLLMRQSTWLTSNQTGQFYLEVLKDYNLFKFRKLLMKTLQLFIQMIFIPSQPVISLKIRVKMSSTIMLKLSEIVWEVHIHNFIEEMLQELMDKKLHVWFSPSEVGEHLEPITHPACSK